MDRAPVRRTASKAARGFDDSQSLYSDATADETPQLQFLAIEDRFTSLQEVSREIRKIVSTQCGLIFGIDFTMSNRIQGMKTFGGRCLHALSDDMVNPYQEIICILGETLESFDDDGIIPAYGFGDNKVKDKGIFPLKPGGHCQGFTEVLDAYNEITKTVTLGGPTNFAPIIDEATRLVKERKQFHLLIIAADGQVVSEEETVDAIVRASDVPLSIVVIGVGDGPWGVMREFDDQLPQRRFDNFQFVDFHAVKAGARNPSTAVALAALMEVPDQYRAITRLGLLENLS